MPTCANAVPATTRMSIIRMATAPVQTMYRGRARTLLLVILVWRVGEFSEHPPQAVGDTFIVRRVGAGGLQFLHFPEGAFVLRANPLFCRSCQQYGLPVLNLLLRQRPDADVPEPCRVAVILQRNRAVMPRLRAEQLGCFRASAPARPDSGDDLRRIQI